MDSRTRTRKLYTWESTTYMGLWAQKDRSIGQLRRLAARIWKLEGMKKPLPRVVAGRGVTNGHDGPYLSYWQECMDRTSVVVLARHQRNVAVLLHELAHALYLGGLDHGPAFARRYLYLLLTYGRVPRHLLDQAQEAGILG